MFSLSQISLDRLKGVDEDLIRVIKHAITISTIDFKVLEGVRTPERQAQLYKEKKTQTLNSKHIIGRAVDLGAMKGSEVVWDKELYIELSKVIKQAAKELNVNIRWGGDFKSFFDGPHFELV